MEEKKPIQKASVIVKQGLENYGKNLTGIWGDLLPEHNLARSEQ